MELILIAALVASNVWLISRFLKRSDTPPPPQSTERSNMPVQHSQTQETQPAQSHKSESIIGESTIDMKEIRELVKIAVARSVKEEVGKIIIELTKPEDVGLLPEEPAKPQIPTVPQEELDEVFTHKTVGESFGENPEPQEPQTGGHDFKAIESAVRVAKDEPHTPEEAKAAKETLTGIQGTVITDRISLDPKVRTRMLSIIYGDPDEPLNEETISKKKVAFSGTIDTFDVDQLNLNILT